MGADLLERVLVGDSGLAEVLIRDITPHPEVCKLSCIPVHQRQSVRLGQPSMPSTALGHSPGLERTH